MIPIEQRVRETFPLIYDGAKGTFLAKYVPEIGTPTDILNLQNPLEVRRMHKLYIDAGSNLIQTNTFCANEMRLGDSGLKDKAYELNLLGALIARTVAGDKIYVAGDIGPTGKIHELAPLGSREFNDFAEAFVPQVKGLIDGGVDLLHIETISDPQEALAAIQAIKKVKPDGFPTMVTMTFETQTPKGLRTMMGNSPADLITLADDHRLLAYGANCGKGLVGVMQLVNELKGNNPNAVIVTKFNAGIPRLVNGVEVYPATPQDMGNHALEMYGVGVKIIGACCGSTPQHIEAMANALAKTPMSLPASCGDSDAVRE